MQGVRYGKRPDLLTNISTDKSELVVFFRAMNEKNIIVKYHLWTLHNYSKIQRCVFFRSGVLLKGNVLAEFKGYTAKTTRSEKKRRFKASI